ncbi:MAG: iron-containing alcohol dehydrogenase [Pseudomonadota bacterium]
MTLITYITRVHFADGVLEEALRSELEVNGKRRPLILVDKTRSQVNEDMIHRLFEGLPRKRNFHIFEYENSLPLEETANTVSQEYLSTGSDVILALGSNSIIDLGKIARVAIAHGKPLSRFTIAEGGSRRIGEKTLPDFYAIPNINGFCSAVSAHAKIIQENGVHSRLMCRKLVPTVTICDPTLTTHVDNIWTASSGVDAISRCMEAYLSPNYNPPADGIAFDGLRRAIHFLPKVLKSNTPEFRREMMAASLNSALALQKGLGTTQVIVDGLEEACHKAFDLGCLRRILLPRVIKMTSHKSTEKTKALCRLFSTSETTELGASLEAFFDGLPLSDRLSELGVDSNKIRDASAIAADAISAAPGLEAIESDLIEEMMMGAV